MYFNLHQGLGLTQKDLLNYYTPLIAFDGIVMTLVGQIQLFVVAGGKEVLVNFIVVHSYSPYTAILGRPWIHSMGPLPFSLQQKVKFTTNREFMSFKGTKVRQDNA